MSASHHSNKLSVPTEGSGHWIPVGKTKSRRGSFHYRDHKEEIEALKAELKSFTDDKNHKGLSKLFASSSNFLKVMWFLAIALGLVLTIYQCNSLASDYFSFDSVTRWSYCRDCIPPFPDITVCNLNPLHSMKRIDSLQLDYRQHLMMIQDYVSALSEDEKLQLVSRIGRDTKLFDEAVKEVWGKTGYFQNIDHEIVEHIHTKEYDLRLIADCKWYDWINKEYHLEDCMESSVYAVYSPGYFECYTFHINDSRTESSNRDVSSLLALLYLDDFNDEVELSIPSSIYGTQSRGLRVLLHPPGSIPDLAKGFNVPPGHEVQLNLVSRERKRLGEPYIHCTKQKYINDHVEHEEEEISETQIRYTYTPEACQSLCNQEANLAICNCFNPNIPLTELMHDVYDHTPYCGALLGEDLQHFKDTMQRVACYMFNEENSTVSRNCPSCVEPCHEFVYDYKLLATPWPHETFHYALFKNINESDMLEPATAQIFQDVYDPISTLAESTDDDDRKEAITRYRSVDLISRNFVQMKVFFKDFGLELFEDVPAISFDAFVGNGAGIINLWLSITFFTFVDIIDLFFHLIQAEFTACRLARKKRKEEENRDDLPEIEEEEVEA